MNPAQTQLQLRDIHLPDSIGWWPPAMGWWLLAVLIPLLCFLIIWLYKRITRKTAVKTAKKLLIKLKQDDSLDDKAKLDQLSVLIRRVAISVSPRKQAASLVGFSWLEYLDSTVKGTPFTEGAGRFLADTHYQQSISPNLDINVLVAVCEDWLKAQKEHKK